MGKTQTQHQVGVPPECITRNPIDSNGTVEVLIAGQTKDIQNANLQSDIGAEVVAGIYDNMCELWE